MKRNQKTTRLKASSRQQFMMARPWMSVLVCAAWGVGISQMMGGFAWAQTAATGPRFSVVPQQQQQTPQQQAFPAQPVFQQPRGGAVQQGVNQGSITSTGGSPLPAVEALPSESFTTLYGTDRVSLVSTPPSLSSLLAVFQGNRVLTLPEALTLVRDRSPQVRASLAGADAATLDAEWVRRNLYYPRLTIEAGLGLEESRVLSSSATATTTAETLKAGNSTSSSIKLTQTLWDAERRAALKQQQTLTVSEEQKALIKQFDTDYEAVKAYVDLMTSRILFELAGTYQKDLQTLYDYMQARAQGGLVSKIELDRVTNRMVNVKSQQTEFAGAYTNSQIAFERLFGFIPGEVRIFQLGLPQNLSFERALEQAYRENPDIVSRRLEREAGEHAVTAAKARLQPRANASFAWSNTELKAASDTLLPLFNKADGSQSKTESMTLGLSADWGINLGGADFYKIDNVKAQLRQLEALEEDNALVVKERLMRSYQILNTISTRIKLVSEELALSEKIVKAFNDQLLTGNRPLLDVLDAYDRRFQAKSTLVQLLIAETTTRMDIARLTGQALNVITGEQ